jgi:hypothetical protein
MTRKRVAAILLCIVLVASQTALAASGSLSNFTAARAYSDGQFADVGAGDWFTPYVKTGYELGLFDGHKGGAFAPNISLTVAQAIKLAACVHSIYYGDKETFAPTGGAWYDPYVKYCEENGITNGVISVYGAPITRADFATILAQSLPDEALTARNKIPYGAIPDVSEGYSYGKSVYTLYRAGVLTGSDASGTFYPGRTISRAEAAAIITRMAIADSRVALSLTSELTATELFAKCAPSVFTIEVRDEEGEYGIYGSGFFISPDGLAVTNCHVMADIKAARILTNEGERYPISGMYDMDVLSDTALIQVEGKSFPYLELADSSKIRTGDTVYTIGSPMGLTNSMSSGIVSKAVREYGGVEYIQIDAPISSGSSGGALFDAYGRVIGITSAGFNAGQNLNLARPINLIYERNRDKLYALDKYVYKIPTYEGFFPTPDFGKYIGFAPFESSQNYYSFIAYYRVDKMAGGVKASLDGYIKLLSECGFANAFEQGFDFGEEFSDTMFYYNEMYGIRLYMEFDVIEGNDYLMISLYPL